MDDELEPSEGNDSEANAAQAQEDLEFELALDALEDEEPQPEPTGYHHEGQPDSECLPHSEPDNVVGVLDLDRNLTPEMSWICLGLNRENQTVHLFVPEGDWPSIFELRGFIEMAANPQFILSQLRTNGE